MPGIETDMRRAEDICNLTFFRPCRRTQQSVAGIGLRESVGLQSGVGIFQSAAEVRARLEISRHRGAAWRIVPRVCREIHSTSVECFPVVVVVETRQGPVVGPVVETRQPTDGKCGTSGSRRRWQRRRRQTELERCRCRRQDEHCGYTVAGQLVTVGGIRSLRCIAVVFPVFASAAVQWNDIVPWRSAAAVGRVFARRDVLAVGRRRQGENFEQRPTYNEDRVTW